jgi:MEMO1 family protein
MSANPRRKPTVAGQFYELNPARLRESVTACLGDYEPPGDIGDPVGGIVPHAGYVYSGPTAAKVFACLSQAVAPEVYVLFGAVHRYGAASGGVYARGAWATPLGEAIIDEPLAEAILQEGDGLLVDSPGSHEGEHSIEVQVPFIQCLSPEANIVPIAVPPGDTAAEIGNAVAKAIERDGRRIVMVASSDLTHYGMGYGLGDHGSFPEARLWMEENDLRIVRLIEQLAADRICDEAEAHYNACGAGAIAAAVSCARARGCASGRVLEYTTSADVMHETKASRAVGYAGILFDRAAA